jgi:hypothetical protein
MTGLWRGEGVWSLQPQSVQRDERTGGLYGVLCASVKTQRSVVKLALTLGFKVAKTSIGLHTTHDDGTHVNATTSTNGHPVLHPALRRGMHMPQHAAAAHDG